MPRVRLLRHVARHVARLVAPLVVDYFASRKLVIDYFTYAARSGASARCAARHAARRRLLRLRRMSGCLGTSRGSSSTTSTTPRVRLLRHVARLVVDYFASATRPGASARHAARRTACRRLLRLRRESCCFGTSRGSSSTTSPHEGSSPTTSPHAGSSSTTSPPLCVRVPRHVTRLVVDYFDYAARPVASARRAARHSAHCRLLRLRRTSGCLGTSRGSSCRSPSITSPTPHVQVPRHVARLVTRLVVNYFVHRDFILRPHWLYFGHVMRHDYLSHGNTGSTSTTRAAATSSFGRIASTIHFD
jgi:hypothetical protein